MGQPYPGWRELRRVGSLVRMREAGLWAAVDAASVEAVAGQPHLFSSEVGADRDASSEFLLTVDPPRHTTDRRLFSRIFQVPLDRAAEMVWADAVVLADELRLEATPIDLMSAFVQPLAATVWSRLTLGDSSVDVASVRAALDDVQTGAALVPLIEALVESAALPGPGPFSEMHAQLRENCRPSEAAARVRFLATAMLVATADTLAGAIALSLNAAMSSHSVMAQLKGASRSGTVDIADQLLVMDSPLHGLFRVATEDAVVCGSKVARGEVVQLCWASASQDQASAVSYTFGHGIHRCPGRRLVLAACGAGLSATLGMLPLARVDSPLDIREHDHVRIPTRLWVRLA